MKKANIHCAIAILFSGSAAIALGDAPNAFVQTNLVSNSAAYNPAFPTLDNTMEDAWGIATRPAGAGGHIWINNAFTGTSDEYIGDVNGTPLYQDGLKSVPLDAPVFTDRGTVFDTGLVYNASSDFVAQAVEFPVAGPARNANNGAVTADYSGSAKFIFCTEDGCINAWASNTATAMYSAPIELDYSKASGTAGNPNYVKLGDTANPVFSGLAITNNHVTASQVGTASGNHIFAADFRNNHLNVFNDQWQNVTSAYPFQTPVSLTGTDQINSSSYNPLNTNNLHVFNVQDLGGHIFATYAAFNDAGDEGFEEIDKNGDGAIVEYNEDGSFVKEFTDATSQTDQLDAPWGMAIAPAGWGPFGGDLLVTNFGDNGTISVFNVSTGSYVGKLDDTNGDPISIDGIWGLTFGNGLSDGDANSLYFTAGPNSEFDGVFGRITVAAVPEPASFGAVGLGLFCLVNRRRRSARIFR
jgi:uncharacterized protein (TIGR03118 family)